LSDLIELYRTHQGKVSDKWLSYLYFYSELFERYRKRPIRILEIGIQNGGSLEIWAKYFPNATSIVGSDINPKCGELIFDDPRISLVVGDANDADTFEQIVGIAGGFDIVIEDGSHVSCDIVRSFARYFSILAEGGVFVAEDLHCSYWMEFEGGVEHPASSINFFKRLADYTNVEHWGVPVPREEILSFYSKTWHLSFDPGMLDRIAEVRFRNSLVAVLKTDPEKVELGQRVLAGQQAIVDTEMLPLAGTRIIVLPQFENPFGPLGARSEQAVMERDLLNTAIANSEETRQRQSAQLNLVNAALADSEETRERQSAQLNLVNAALAEMKHGGAMMAEEMRQTEHRPWRPLKWAIQRGVLKFVLLFGGLMPERVNLRLRRALAKRKPRRHVYSWSATVAKASGLDVPVDPLLAPRERQDGGLIRNKRARNLRQTKLNAQPEQQEAQTTSLDEELVSTRTRPMHVAQKLIQFRALTLLSKISAPISPRRAARFANSAAKRDPSRPTLAMTQKTKQKDQPDYNAVLRSWSEQRAAGSLLHTQMVDSLRDGPLISLAVPVYNPDPDLLSQMIKSALEQSYPNWELCMADDCSTDKRVVEMLNAYAAQDKRIRVVFREENGHISRATNSAINICNGRFIALLDHDDLLDPDALLWVVKAIRDEPRVRIIYTDEDKVREDGSRYDPHFKPDWNRDLLYCTNYVSHLGVYETALVREVGGFREGFEGAQDYDLLLRCVEKVLDSQIVHIPKVLYSWRAIPGSTASSNTAKPYASAAGERALAEHLKRTTGQDITVSPGPVPFTYRANWTVKENPLVSIIIPTRDHLNVLKVAVESVLSKTDYANFELIIIDNGSVEPCTLQWFDRVTAQDNRVRVLKDDRPFNYSALNNNAVIQSRGEYLALVNNDIEVISPGWLSEMVALAQRPRAGCVGAKLYYPDGRIQHAGVLIAMGGVAGHLHSFFPAEHPGYFRRLTLRQNYTAVTGACLVVRRSIYDEVEGLNEKDLAISFNDVDFCLKVDAAGYRNIWTPWAELIHHESISRGYEDTPEKQARFRRECDYMKRRWRTHEFNDPAYNPNLTLSAHDFGLGPANWKLK
jgi:glycosyltransferase involved in cell wall biosynthesis/SAM-dependent methyltransferase